MQLRGVKRWCLFLMIAAVPFASSEPISLSQEIPSLNHLPAAQGPRILKLTPQKETRVIKKKKTRKAQLGIASWYSQADAGINRHTANGEIFNDRELTCASWYHEFGTLLKVTNRATGKSVVCRVNDRGPNKRLGRLVDLTIGAFRQIATPHRGLIRVSVIKISK